MALYPQDSCLWRMALVFGLRRYALAWNFPF
jgi:hypothetical protein